MNDTFVNDICKGVSDTKIGQLLDPGSTKRRWEPSCGIEKHNERIHRESKYADEYKNLPFKFSKPKKGYRSDVLMCSNCGYVFVGNINTVGIVCRECNRYSSVIRGGSFGW